MNANARDELDSIIGELNSIIRELEDISAGVRSDFVGIGNEKCADCIDRVLNQYYSVRYTLKNLDTTAVASGFEKA